LALDFARERLKPGGHLLVKIFHGAGYMDLRRQMTEVFESVEVRKPGASRQTSAETYLLARNKRL